MTKRTKYLARLFSCVFILMIVFSVFVIAAESAHDCTGSDCPVCELIAICGNVLRGTGLACTVTVVFTCALMYGVMINQADFMQRKLSTPVSLKVKLLN